jgi:Na+/H+ antiporter NhaD/arsenite permease-like protein
MDILNSIFLFPFFGLLITIAVFPLINPHLWEKNITKAIVSAIFGVPVLIYLIAKSPGKVLHVGEEFISFISLVTSLFIVSGGIFIYIRKKPTPLLNTAILFLGSILANFVGTTGASMILVRPFLRLNRWRKNTFHIPVFFIFTVSNIGGGLTPIGDPPLFMGFLKGVPFFWSLKLFPIWLFEISVVLLIFFIWDSITLKNEKYPEALAKEEEKILIYGKRNFIYLGLILLAVILLHFPFREIVQWTAAILSLKTTPKRIREDNEFTFHPAEEVAIVFAGIFATMTPVLDYLKDNADKFGISEPWQFFFLTGALSSFLDNAPTYLTFFSLAQGLSEKFGLTPQVAGVWEPFLKAISCGSVFFGANTYIGNAPNFMVKSISEEMRIKAPNFIAYLLYSFLILLPSFFAVAFIFFGFGR